MSGDGQREAGEGAEHAVPRFPAVARLELDELLDRLLDRAQDVQAGQNRLRGLLTATQIVAGDLSLPAVLRHIVEAARDLIGARYAALGVVREGRLVEFIHAGMDAATVGRIGHLPDGPGPPPADAELSRRSDPGAGRGVRQPLPHRQEHGWTSAPTAFTADDEQLVVALAAAAAVAIDNARLFADAQRRQRWLVASMEITHALLAGHATIEVEPLALIALLARQTADADLTTILVRSGEDHLVVQALSGPPLVPIGHAVPIQGTWSGQVLQSGEPRSIGDFSQSPPSTRSGTCEPPSSICTATPFRTAGRAWARRSCRFAPPRPSASHPRFPSTARSTP